MHLEQDRLVRALLDVMESDVADIFDERSHLRQIRDIPDATRRAIASVKVRQLKTRRGEEVEVEESIIEVRFWPKVQAAEAMARIVGLTGDTSAQAPPTVEERQSIVAFGKTLFF